MSDPVWMKPEEAAPLLGCSTREVQQLCSTKAIDHQRKASPGGRVRYLLTRDAIDRYLNRTIVRAKRGA